MSNFKITRTIHPVGQGAFYSEVLKIDDIVLKTVVYDCGTTTEGKYLNNEIKNLFAKNSNKPIDLLFISHFHEDHINGIPDLINSKKVNKIVIPNVSSGDFILEYTHNLILNPLSETLTFMNRCARVLFENKKDDLIEVAKDSYPIFDNIKRQLWKYTIPQLEISHNKKMSFLINLLCRLSKVTDILDNIYNVYKNNDKDFKAIKDAYLDCYKTDPNSYSMLVLSTKGDDVKGDNLACLYTGDAKISKYEKFTNAIDYQFIQVPHHGSLLNSTSSKGTLSSAYNKKCEAFISHGNNHKKHPSTHLLALLQNNNNTVHQIDETKTPMIRDMTFIV